MWHMTSLHDYVKEKNKRFIDAFFELYDKKVSERGRDIKHASRRIEVDIDNDYKLVVMWADTWQLVYKESTAILISVQEHNPSNALPELISKFTESVIEDYWFK